MGRQVQGRQLEQQNVRGALGGSSGKPQPSNQGGFLVEEMHELRLEV